MKAPRVRKEPVYTPAFEELWVGCERQGTKSTAMQAWGEVSNPDPAETVAAWKRYRASMKPELQPKDVSTWLRAFGHKQEWTPRQQALPVAKPAASFAVREEEERRARVLAEKVANTRWR